MMITLRRIFKYLGFGVSLVLVSPLILIVRVEGVVKGREGLYNCVGTCLSLIPGTIGSFLRRGFYFGTSKKCSWDVSIEFGSFFAHREVVIGRNVGIGAYSIIGCTEIGDNVLIGSRVSIPSGKYQHLGQNGEVTHEEVRRESIKIGRESWIGEGAIVLSDVGEKCIVSAGSVVMRPLPNNYMASGNPARLLNRQDFGKR